MLNRGKIFNDGFHYPTLDKLKDYVLGGVRSAPFEIINEKGDWKDWLPEKEQQRKTIETFSCTNFGSLNLIEILTRFNYGIRLNFSDRFQAIVSEQKRNGNSPIKVLESIRKSGVLDEILLPFTKEQNTWEKYFNPVPMTKRLKKIAQNWLLTNDFKHEYIYLPYSNISRVERQKLLLQALKRSPVGVSVFAWQKDGDLYIKPDGVSDTHWCVLVGAKENEYWEIFDSYSPFVKRLSWDFDFDIAEGVYLGKKKPKTSLLVLILNWFKGLKNKIIKL